MFNELCWTLNVWRLSRMAALLRWLVYQVVKRRATTRFYGRDDVGYDGWIEYQSFGVLAFIRTDGTLQFRW